MYNTSTATSTFRYNAEPELVADACCDAMRRLGKLRTVSPETGTIQGLVSGLGITGADAELLLTISTTGDGTSVAVEATATEGVFSNGSAQKAIGKYISQLNQDARLAGKTASGWKRQGEHKASGTPPTRTRPTQDSVEIPYGHLAQVCDSCRKQFAYPISLSGNTEPCPHCSKPVFLKYEALYSPPVPGYVMPQATPSAEAEPPPASVNAVFKDSINVLTPYTLYVEDREFANPIDAHIEAAVYALMKGTAGFLILQASSDGNIYMQTFSEDGVSFFLECHDGSDSRHFRASRTFTTSDELIRRMISYRHGGTEWSEGVEWEQIAV